MDSNLSEAGPPQERVDSLRDRLSEILESLDKAELHGAAAYVSMALDSIQRDYPRVNSTR